MSGLKGGFKRLALVGLCLALPACSQVVNIGRDSDVHDAAALNPFGQVVEYDVDPALVLDNPRRICIGVVTVSVKDDVAPPRSDGAATDHKDGPGAVDMPDLLRRSLVAHARMRFEDLGIAVAAAKPDEDPIAAALDGCTYILTANLVEDDQFYTLVWSRRRLGVELRLSDIDTDQTLWTARHVDTRDEASLPLDPFGLMLAAFRAQDFADDKDIRPSMLDDVMRRLFATFPVLAAPDEPHSDG